jgi:WD40 repeat protein
LLSLACSNKNSKIALGVWEQSGPVIIIQDSGTNKILRYFDRRYEDAQPRLVAFSPNSNIVLSANQIVTESTNQTINVKSSLALIDLNSGKALQLLTEPNSLASAIAYSQDGQYIAAVTEEGSLFVWSTETYKLQFTKKDLTTLYSVTFGPAGRFIAMGTGNGRIILYQVSSGEEAITIDGHVGAVNTLSFHPNGKLLASGGRDGTVRLWNIETWQLQQEFKEHRNEVTSVSFSADGSFLVSGSLDGTIRIWRLS